MPVHVGTSGWQYRDWRGPFYPARLPVRCWLEHYTHVFGTVEVNAAFYRLPARVVFETWAAETPARFVVAVKASRYLTHIKRLQDPAEPVARLMDRVAGLGAKAGPMLVQLPPTLRADAALLEECLRCFPAGTRVAVEPREASWFTAETYAVLRRFDAALVWADRDGRPVSPLVRTASWGYLRFHHEAGPPGRSYRTRVLARWARTVRAAWPARASVYCYFNNDPGSAAPRDALRFRSLVSGAVGPGGTWPIGRS